MNERHNSSSGAMWEIFGHSHGEVFHTIKPAATMVEVWALIRPEQLVEIEVSAMMCAE